MVEWIIQLANITVSSTNTVHSSTMSLWGYSSPYWGNRNWHWRQASQSPHKVDCGKVQTFCINLIWKYIKPVNLNIPHIEVYTVTVATHLYKINNSWLGGESFWLVCLQYNVNDNAAIEHAINSTPSRNLTAEVVDIQHIYNDMPKNPRYWWPTIFLEIYRSTLA